MMWILSHQRIASRIEKREKAFNVMTEKTRIYSRCVLCNKKVEKQTRTKKVEEYRFHHDAHTRAT